MRYCRLRPDEWDRLAFVCRGRTLPDPHLATAIVAEDESTGEIVMVGFFMLAAHFDNVVGTPGSGASLGALLAEFERGVIEDLPPGQSLTYYSFVGEAPSGHAVALRNGMTPLTGHTPYSKTIGSN